MRKVIPVLCFFLISSILFGWGAGHNDQVSLVLKLLPEEITEFFPEYMKEKMIKKYSHYPDSFSKIDQDILNEEDKKLLEKFRIKVRYNLHSPIGKTISFILMTEGFKEKNIKKAAIFMCALTHAIGDESACNHAPLVHVLTYGFNQYNIKKGKGLLDFSQVKDKELIEKLTKGFSVKKISDDGEKTLREIMIAGVKMNSYMIQRDVLIAKTYNYKLTEEERKQGMKALAELGVEGAKFAADVIYTSWIYSKKGKIPILTSGLIEEYKKENKKYLMDKPLIYDSIYKDVILEEWKYPAIGVLVEPSRRMNECYFSFSSKVIQSAIMRVLKKEKKPYKCIDVRELIKGEKIDKKKIPVLVICAGSFSVPKNVKEEIKRYTQEGGKLIWIAGSSKGVGKLSEFLKTAENKFLPVTRKYGNLHKEVINRVNVYFENELKDVFGSGPYKFINNPNTPAGWQKPYCAFYIEEGAKNIKILAKIETDGKILNVAGYLCDEEGNPVSVFIPEYLISPFLLVNEDTTDYDFSKPILDSVGKKIILTLIKILTK